MASASIVGATTVTVTSSSNIVGQPANYTITVTNQTEVSKVEFTFSNWTNSSTDPFSGTTQLSFSGSTFIPIIIPHKLVCSLGTTVTASTF